MDRDANSPVMTAIKSRHQTPFVDNQSLPEKDVRFIVRAVRNTPSKQNHLPYRVVALPAQQEFKKFLVEKVSWCSQIDKQRLGKAKSWEEKNANSQYGHPLLLMFLTNDSLETEKHCADIEIGLAAANAMYSATELGYSTSFAKCFGRDNSSIAKIINDYADLQGKKWNIRLTICIGKEIDSYKDNTITQGHHRPLYDDYGDPWAKEFHNIDPSIRTTVNRHNRIDHVTIVEKDIPVSKKWIPTPN